MFSDGLFELNRFLRFDVTPSFFDLWIFDPILDRWNVSGLRFEICRGRHHIEPVGLLGLTIVRSGVGHRIKRNFNLLNILIGHPRDVLHRWPEVIDHVVVSDNVGDVPGLTIDLNVPTARLDIAGVARFVPMRIPDKRIGSRSNVIIRVGPG